MASLDKPKLRPLSGRPAEREGRRYLVLEDPLRVFEDPLLLPVESYQYVVRHFDGETPLREIQARAIRETGSLISLADIESLVKQLDEAMILDGPTFESFHNEYRAGGVRRSALAGRSYAGTERALRAQLNGYFVGEKGAGEPKVEEKSSDRRLRGILSPHIDFHRGGPVYTWPYKELRENCDAEIFVILGVAHQYCRRRFALTRKDFETPLGLARTDRHFVDRVARDAGEHLFEDELAHRTEHSIEFQVVFLQHVLGDRRDYSIVPILVGSFHDLMESGRDPIDDIEVRKFVESLRAAERESSKKVAYIGGIDLCHVGPEFGDPERVAPPKLEEIRRFDSEMLDRASAVDARGWFDVAAREGNRHRVCGLAATYVMLQVMGEAEGRLLSYDQALNPERTCCVTFAGVAYDVSAAVPSP